jgi:hypothetical protein
MRIARVLPVLAVAVMVAAVVLGVGLLRHVGADESPTGTSSRTAAAQAQADPTVDIDLGDTTPADVTACLTPDFATSADQVEVRYGEQQSTSSGRTPVLVLRNQAGELRLCDVFGGDSPAEAPLPAADRSNPVVFLSNGHSAWSCQGTDKVLKKFQMTLWLSVAPQVRTVQQRFWVNGVPGPWFSTTAKGGYAHLQSWLEGPEPAGTRFAVEYRVRDASGDAVPQSALPTGRKPLPGCSSGGSAEIG